MAGSSNTMKMDPKAQEVLTQQYRDLDQVASGVETIRGHLARGDTQAAQHEVERIEGLLRPLISRTREIVSQFDPATGANPSSR